MIHDRQISISIGQSRTATVWKPQQFSIAEFYARLEMPQRSVETLAEYLTLTKAEQDSKKDVGGFVGGTLNGPRRKADRVTGRDLVTLDFDNIPPYGTEKLLSALDGLGCGYCVYSTRKHRAEAPRLRAILPSDRTMTVDEFGAVSRRVAAQIGIGWADPTTFEACRLMYWPSCSADGEYIFQYKDSPLLSVDATLATYVDWHDPTSWPRHPNDNDNIRASLKRQGDPESKAGVVGAFCRTYDIHRAISELIPDAYTPVDLSGSSERYTYANGSTSGGAVIYDSGKFLFSHHATDPCGGKLVNSFDLVRLQKFGDLDDAAVPGTPTGRLPSYTAMKDYAGSLPEIRVMLSATAAEFAGLETAPGASNEWKSKLDIAASGGLKSTFNNLCLILEHDSHFAGKLKRDIFHESFVVDGDLPWGHVAGTPWEDVDSDHLRLWFERLIGGKVTAADVLAAISTTADKNTFHPVRDYLTSLVWDGTPRLDRLFIDYLGAEDSAYTRAAARKSLVAAVARAMEPGCKYDVMPVLVGGQGRYKSTTLSILGGEWFSDSLRTFEGQKAEEQLRGVWLIEISELQAFDRSTVEAVKAFLSKQSDRYRPAYGRLLRDFPRQCVFFGTTNTPDFLRDNTGGRRFWPIDCDVQKRTKSVANDLPNERDQIWAEAMARWRLGERLYLTGDVEQAAIQSQEDHRELDAWEGLLTAFIAKPVPEDWDDETKWTLNRRRAFLHSELQTGDVTPPLLVERSRVSATEFLCEMLNFDPRNLSKQDTTRVGKILRGLHGWEPRQGTIPIYGKVRYYTLKK